MKKNKQKIIKFSDINSSDDLLFQICNKLKLKGWQFDKLTIEEKILKWLKRNIDKELIIEMYKESILKNIEEIQSRNISYSRVQIPKDYEIGNPHNRWVHNDPIFRTQEQVDEKKKRYKLKQMKNIEK